MPMSTEEQAYTLSDLLAAISVPEASTVTARNTSGAVLWDTDPVGTGCTVTVSDGTNASQYTVLIMGDVAGTGQLDMAQIVRLAQDLTDVRPLEGVYKMAAKVSRSDGAPNIADLVILAQMLTASET